MNVLVMLLRNFVLLFLLCLSLAFQFEAIKQDSFKVFVLASVSSSVLCGVIFVCYVRDLVK